MATEAWTRTCNCSLDFEPECGVPSNLHRLLQVIGVSLCLALCCACLHSERSQPAFCSDADHLTAVQSGKGMPEPGTGKSDCGPRAHRNGG